MKSKEAVYNDYVGKKINLWLASTRRPVVVIITEVDPKEKRATKFRAYRRSDSLGKLGFIKEGDQWIIQEWQICRN